jgi:hypothetical protein
MIVPRPPKSTPHSDIDGVHRDEKKNVDTTQETGESTANLALAKDESMGKPPYTPEESEERPR